MSTTTLDSDDLRRRVTGCWLGKAVGGTLGMPFEGVTDTLDLSFYDPVPAEMLPNDDLDLQVLWAAVLQRQLDSGEAVRVDRHDLAAAFLENVDFPFDEYGVAIRNLRLGLSPPWTGRCDNWFTNGMGAAIRSEVWACLAAGDPALAAAYAREDAVLDHAGPGVDAEVFFAALEASAFTADRDADPRPMIEAAASHLPPDSQTAGVARDTIAWWDDLGDWRAVRGQILGRYGSDNVTDTTQNVGFTLLGWLAGGGDFGRTLCVAVGCGYDADCTGATAGALMGILDPGGIGEDWLRPIGRQLVVSPPVRPPAGTAWPATLDEFTDQVLRLRDALAGRRPDAREADAPDPSTLAVPIRRAFDDWRTRPGCREHFGLPGYPLMPTPRPTLPADAEAITLPGTFATLAAKDFGGPTLLIEFALDLAAGREILLMFNSPQPHRVWLNDDLVIARESGRMAPSFHRVPVNQWAHVELPAGRHAVTVASTRPDAGVAEWVIGAGDRATRQWLPDAFRGRLA